MLRRKIETQLEAWRSAPKRTALLVTGARQIGKTYIIRHFAQQHYDHIAELNFIENPDLVALFDRPRDAKNLLMRLELAVNTPLVPGKTLIFFVYTSGSIQLSVPIFFTSQSLGRLRSDPRFARYRRCMCRT